jgi:hypothetical protein
MVWGVCGDAERLFGFFPRRYYFSFIMVSITIHRNNKGKLEQSMCAVPKANEINMLYRTLPHANQNSIIL